MDVSSFNPPEVPGGGHTIVITPILQVRKQAQTDAATRPAASLPPYSAVLFISADPGLRVIRLGKPLLDFGQQSGGLKAPGVRPPAGPGRSPRRQLDRSERGWVGLGGPWCSEASTLTPRRLRRALARPP